MSTQATTVFLWTSKPQQRSYTTRIALNSSQESSPFCFVETDERCASNTKFLLVLRSLDLATISFPGRTSISFVDGEDPPIALDLCTLVSLLFYLIFIIFSVRQRHGASWAIPAQLPSRHSLPTLTTP